LATVSSEGEPHVVPLCYALLNDSIYFVVDEKPKRTHLGLMRLRNIHTNPQVALVIDDYDDDWTQLAYLLLHGRATIVSNHAEFERALQLLCARYPQYAKMPLDFKLNPVVRIAVERTYLWRATSATDGS